MAVLRAIGNSKGVLLPKSLIEQAGLEGRELEFQLEAEGLLIKPVKKNRVLWESQIDIALQKQAHDIDDEWLNSDLVDLSDE